MCIECDLNRTYNTMLCVPCRKVWKSRPWPTCCPSCGIAGVNMGWKWRAPRLTNRKAWKLIESGDYLWDKKAVSKSKKAQREQAQQDRWEWIRLHSKPGSLLPKNAKTWRRKFF